MSPLLESIEIETAPKPEHAIIWLHGLGADGHDFAPIVPELRLPPEQAVRFVFPHAPVQPVTINGGMAMRSWYDIYVADLVRHEDEQGLRQSEQAIQALIARENARGIPSKQIILAGFSQGCAMTLQTGLRLAEPLAGMICLSGYLPLAAKTEAERHTANTQTPIFMAHGTMDPVVPIARAQESRDLLQSWGYTVHWHEYAMQHSVNAQEVQAISQFIHNTFKSAQP